MKDVTNIQPQTTQGNQQGSEISRIKVTVQIYSDVRGRRKSSSKPRLEVVWTTIPVKFQVLHIIQWKHEIRAVWSATQRKKAEHRNCVTSVRSYYSNPCRWFSADSKNRSDWSAAWQATDCLTENEWKWAGVCVYKYMHWANERSWNRCAGRRRRSGDRERQEDGREWQDLKLQSWYLAKRKSRRERSSDCLHDNKLHQCIKKPFVLKQ